MNKISTVKVECYLLYVIIFSLFLSPAVKVFGFLPAIRLDELLIYTWLVLTVVIGNKLVVDFSKLIIFAFLAIFALVNISILNGVMNGYSATFSDLNQYLRFLKYLGCFLLAVKVFSHFNYEDLRRFYFFLVAILFLLAVFSYMQRFNLFGVNDFVLKFVSNSEKYDALLKEVRGARVIGFAGNPNVFAFLFVYLLIVLWGFKQYYLTRGLLAFQVLIIFSIFGLLFTLSRTGLLSLLVGFVTLTIFTLGSNDRHFAGVNYHIKRAMLLFFSLIIVYLILTTNYFQESVLFRFVDSSNLSESTSFQSRLVEWEANLSIIASRPIWGVGPLSRSGIQAVDNEYLLILRSYGLVGLVTIFTLLYQLLKWSRKRRGSRGVSDALILSSLVMMIPASVVMNLILFPVLLIILAFVRSTARVIEGLAIEHN